MSDPKYRHALPQLQGQFLLTDSGLETTLIFHDGMDLPCFASFDLMRSQAGRQRLLDYYVDYAEMAARFGVGLVLETPTWRASKDWGAQLGYDANALEVVNTECVEMMHEIRSRYETPGRPHVISGNIGPRGDGYQPDSMMNADEAQAYHAVQIETFVKAGVDLVSFFTANYVEEAVGIVRAAQNAGVPVVISFTTETDGKLPTGQSLQSAIEQTDAATGNGPAYFMVNCAHPTHFAHVLTGNGAWLGRIRGFRANASRMSHAELDNATELDDGNPAEFGKEHGELLRLLPHATVIGGCCGTDHRHVEAIGHVCIGHHDGAGTHAG